MNKIELQSFVIEAARKHRSEFEKVIGRFEDRGILNSEMLAVCAVAEECGVEVFIESGRWLGQSTEILAQYFNGKPVVVESIEAFNDKNALHVENKLAGKNDRLNLLYGDANIIIPRLAEKYRGKRIALLFDGPKGQAALDVFRLALLKNNQVMVGFFHDMRRPTEEMPNGSRQEMEAVFPNSFFTDDESFVSEFKLLDQGCDAALWSPYEIDGKKIGSYGPTIGLFFPSEKDQVLARKLRLKIQLRSLKQILMLVAVKTYHWLRRRKAV